jgi:hypothetical protein
MNHCAQLGFDFLGTKQKAQSIKEKNGKLGFIKSKSVCSVKDTAKKMKDKPQTGRQYLQNIYLIKDWHEKFISKNSYNSTIIKQTTQFENGQTI